MPRSGGNLNPGLVARIIFYFAKRRLGRVPLGTRIRAFDPKYLRDALRLDLYGISSKTVPMHLKEVAQLKVALDGRLSVLN